MDVRLWDLQRQRKTFCWPQWWFASLTGTTSLFKLLGIALGSRLYFSSLVIIFPKGERATLSMTALVIGLIKINHIPPPGWHNPTDNIFQKETKESEKLLHRLITQSLNEEFHQQIISTRLVAWMVKRIGQQTNCKEGKKQLLDHFGWFSPFILG